MQASLFQTNPEQNHYTEHQLGDGKISEYPHAFDSKESESLLATLMELIPWQQDYLRIAGKTVAVPRLQCWMGDSASNYGYSGIRLTPSPWQSDVSLIRQRVENLCDLKFNSVLLNYYRNGNDSVAWHADDEVELGKNPIIASVSFGVERKFQLKRKQATSSSQNKFIMTLGNGSLIVMGKDLQQNWLHQVPKEKHLQEPRINLIFRNIVTSQHINK